MLSSESKQELLARIPTLLAISEAVGSSEAPVEAASVATRHGAPPSLSWPVVLVGPEGGWSPEEEGAGLPRLGLGPQVLRAETAALAAGAVLAALRAGLVQESGP